MTNYEDRFVLFLDILGFREIIDKTVEDEVERSDRTTEIINVLSEVKKLVSIRSETTTRMTTQFSDSVVISFKQNDTSELGTFLLLTQRLIVTLAHKGIFCRGAISFGKLYHTSDLVFGPALNEAYVTESQAALYPRVILDKSAIEIMRYNYTNNGSHHFRGVRFDTNISELLKQDTDDKFFVDYFAGGLSYYPKEKLSESVSLLRERILLGLKSKSPSVQIKYGWMRNKFNQIPDDLERINVSYDGILYITRPDLEHFHKSFEIIQ